MLFLADQDFPGVAVRWLREAGQDVLWARTSMPGQSDAGVILLRVIRLTHDLRAFPERSRGWVFPTGVLRLSTLGSAGNPVAHASHKSPRRKSGDLQRGIPSLTLRACMKPGGEESRRLRSGLV
jgi:hypothetical protein